MGYAQWLRALLVAMLLILRAAAAHADPQVGWWWNPNESGRGFFIESTGGTFYMAAYFYADDGRARWLVSGGANDDPYSYSGQLLEVAQGQTLFGPYVPPGAPVGAGAITVSFSDDTHGTITWPGGVIPIVREIFDGTEASFQPESGWWWNPDESGSGYSMEVQGSTLFMVGFMYDSSGNPIWYLSAGPMSSDTTYTGSLVQVANGQTMSGPYHPPSAPAPVGTLSVAFTAPDTATLTITAAGSMASGFHAETGESRTISVRREFAAKPHPYTFPAGYDLGDSNGLFFQTLTRDASEGLEDAELVFHAIGQGLNWKAQGAPTAVPPGSGLKGSVQQLYVGSGGSVEVTASFTSSSIISVCSGGVPKKKFVFVPYQTTLTVTDMAEYQISIGMTSTVLQFSFSITCTIPTGGTFTKPFSTQADLKVIGKGIINGTTMIGSFGPLAEPASKREGRWFFFATQ